jgi:hypothetical protein
MALPTDTERPPYRDHSVIFDVVAGPGPPAEIGIKFPKGHR